MGIYLLANQTVIDHGMHCRLANYNYYEYHIPFFLMRIIQYVIVHAYIASEFIDDAY